MRCLEIGHSIPSRGVGGQRGGGVALHAGSHVKRAQPSHTPLHQVQDHPSTSHTPPKAPLLPFANPLQSPGAESPIARFPIPPPALARSQLRCLTLLCPSSHHQSSELAREPDGCAILFFYPSLPSPSLISSLSLATRLASPTGSNTLILQLRAITLDADPPHSTAYTCRARPLFENTVVFATPR
jgi:hypothetical protein